MKIIYLDQKHYLKEEKVFMNTVDRVPFYKRSDEKGINKKII